MSQINWQQARQILNEAYRPSISLRPIFAELMGNSLTAGMYLSRAHYWSDKGRDSDGWIYKTCDEFKSETFLSRRQQDKAREALRDKPWWSEKLARVGTTPKFHYRIDRDLLDAEVINFILSKCEDNLTASDLIASSKSDLIASSKSDLIASSKSDLIASSKSDLITAIAYTKTDSSKNTFKDYFPDPDRTNKKKSADAEAEFPIQEASPPIQPLESPTNTLDVQTHQLAREGGKQSILEGNESTINSPLAVDPDLTPEREGSAARRPTAPPRVTHRDRAMSSSILHRGINNNRWRNLDEFKSFREYATEWAAIRLARPELGTPGQAYDDEWVQRVLSNTANCTDSNSPNLTLWTAWVNKAPKSEIVNQDIPEFTPIPTSQATLGMVAKYKAECAAKAAAKAQAEKDEAIENARWEIHHEN
jgi:hypothetical protein